MLYIKSIWALGTQWVCTTGTKYSFDELFHPPQHIRIQTIQLILAKMVLDADKEINIAQGMLPCYILIKMVI